MFDQNFAGVEVLLTEDASGSHGDDVITGNEGRNYLRGADGDDVVDGGADSDRFEGGVGTDTLSFFDSTTAATVDLSMGVARQDLAIDDVSMFENVVGSWGYDRLIGDSRPNVLDGGLGGASMTGGGGDDTMVRGGVDYTDAPNGVRVDLVAGWATGVGKDTLTGGSGQDELHAGRGADILNARDAFSDHVYGGPQPDECLLDRSDLVRGCSLRSSRLVMAHRVSVGADKPSAPAGGTGALGARESGIPGLASGVGHRRARSRRRCL